MSKGKKYLWDRADGRHYIRAWVEGKGRDREYAVQVWLNKAKPEGEPDGDWAMPFAFGLQGSIEQSIVNTLSDAKRKEQADEKA
jgi:hypothetical protein